MRSNGVGFDKLNGYFRRLKGLIAVALEVHRSLRGSHFW